MSPGGLDPASTGRLSEPDLPPSSFSPVYPENVISPRAATRAIAAAPFQNVGGSPDCREWAGIGRNVRDVDNFGTPIGCTLSAGCL